jgi:hypothetical protein
MSKRPTSTPVTRAPKLRRADGTIVAAAPVAAPAPAPVADAPVAAVETAVTPVADAPVADAPVAVPFDVATVAAITAVHVTSPDGARSFTVPVSPAIARIVRGLRAGAAVAPVAGDYAATFAARVTAIRNGYDAGTVATDWNAVPFGRATFGASIMDAQNTIYAAATVAGVVIDGPGFMAAWRAFIPRTKCEFETRPYGISALADLARGDKRPVSVATVPAGAYARLFAAWYAENGYRKPWTVADATVPATVPANG